MRPTAPLLAGLCALTLAACGDTVQSRPIPHNILEGLVAAPSTVYWLGRSFQGMAISEATHDPGGAYTVLYGPCLQGGQGTCIPPLRVVSSPDNSFLPVGAARTRTVAIRGQPALLAQGGRTVILATGTVVVGIYARDAATAQAAARAMVAINAPGAPGQALPARMPDTGFGSRPLPAQLPSQLRPLS